VSHRRRLVLLAAIAVLPPTWKPRLYARLFGYRIHPSARIGVTILDAGEVDIAAGVTIGHGNLVLRVGRLSIGQRTRIGMLNVVRGGTHVDIGRYVDMLRRNELTSIVELDLAPGCEPDPCLRSTSPTASTWVAVSFSAVVGRPCGPTTANSRHRYESATGPTSGPNVAWHQVHRSRRDRSSLSDPSCRAS
jgi:hypothetical protein